jgi:hypothetical protein
MPWPVPPPTPRWQPGVRAPSSPPASDSADAIPTRMRAQPEATEQIVLMKPRVWRYIIPAFAALAVLLVMGIALRTHRTDGPKARRVDFASLNTGGAPPIAMTPIAPPPAAAAPAPTPAPAAATPPPPAPAPAPAPAPVVASAPAPAPVVASAPAPAPSSPPPTAAPAPSPAPAPAATPPPPTVAAAEPPARPIDDKPARPSPPTRSARAAEPLATRDTAKPTADLPRPEPAARPASPAPPPSRPITMPLTATSVAELYASVGRQLKALDETHGSTATATLWPLYLRIHINDVISDPGKLSDASTLLYRIEDQVARRSAAR